MTYIYKKRDYKLRSMQKRNVTHYMAEPYYNTIICICGYHTYKMYTKYTISICSLKEL